MRLGCKGCTTYRPNDVTGSVLEHRRRRTRSEPVAETLPPLAPARPRETGGVVYMTRPLDRPEVLIGQTYKIKWLDSDHAFYITINDIEKDGRRRPFEVFINSKNMEAYAWAVALTRMISAVFRRGGDVSFVVDELKAIFDPRGGQWSGGRYVPSLMAAIGEVIEKHMVDTGFIAPRDAPLVAEERRAVAVAAEGAPARFCPRCCSPSFVKLEGCDQLPLLRLFALRVTAAVKRSRKLLIIPNEKARALILARSGLSGVRQEGGAAALAPLIAQARLCAARLDQDRRARASSHPLFAPHRPIGRAISNSLQAKTPALFEHWTHDSSLIPMEHLSALAPPLRAHQRASPSGASAFGDERVLKTVRDHIAAEGRHRWRATSRIWADAPARGGAGDRPRRRSNISGAPASLPCWNATASRRSTICPNA